MGGDGTLKLVAECLLNTETPIGIIPAGSANGMAKDLDIPLDIEEALEVAAYGTPKKFMPPLLMTNYASIYQTLGSTLIW